MLSVKVKVKEGHTSKERRRGAHLPFTGWRGGLVVGRRTCDIRVAGSRPGRDAAAQQP